MTLETSEPATLETPLSALVVDDDPAVRALCRRLLEREGWFVAEAEDGAAALAAVRNGSIDLVIMDVMMPNVDGLEATRRLRADPLTHEVCIIMLSAKDDPSDVAAGLQTGADGYLAKPLNKQLFLPVIRTLARLRRFWREMQRSHNILGEQARSLGLLLDLSWAMARTDELDPLLGTVIEMSALLTSCRCISVLLPDRDHRRLRIARSIGLDGQLRPKSDIPVEDAIAGRAFMSTQTVLANTSAEAESFAKAADRFLLVQPPWASVPMCADGRVVGVLNVSDRISRQPFSLQEAEYLALIANHSAAAIENLLMRKSRDEAYESVVVALAKLAEYRDDDTGKHLDRVTMYCVTLAEELRKLPQFESVIDKQFIRNIRLAAPLHDIGKVAIPDSVLLKPGKLTETEMAVMRTHVIVGLETVKSVLAQAPDSSFLYMAEEMIGGHHEWFDGAGYPNCLQGEEIPLSGRIMALADVYDALATKRAYKEAMPHARAMEIIKQQCGTQFDPVIVAAFLRCAAEFERLSRELTDTVGAAARPTRAELIQRQGCPVTAK